MKAIVFAGNYKEYKHLMQECGIPVTHREWLWVADVYRILPCLRGTPYILYGTWQERHDAPYFQEVAKVKGFVRVVPVDIR